MPVEHTLSILFMPQTLLRWLFKQKHFALVAIEKLLPRFIAESTKDKNVYKLLDGLDLTDYTFGVHGESNLKEAIGWSR